MKIFTCTDHDGHYPVGVASIIVAKDKEQARFLLDFALKASGLNPKKEPLYNLKQVNLSKPLAYILNDGEY